MSRIQTGRYFIHTYRESIVKHPIRKPSRGIIRKRNDENFGRLKNDDVGTFGAFEEIGWRIGGRKLFFHANHTPPCGALESFESWSC